MSSTNYLVPRGKKKGKVRQGPIYSEDNIPYDYIIIIDSGSKGSRVYVYNWLNPTYALNAGLNLRDITKESFKLVNRLYIPNDEAEFDNPKRSYGEINNPKTSYNGINNPSKSSMTSYNGINKVSGLKTKKSIENIHTRKKDKNKKKPSSHIESVVFPNISNGKKWNLKIKPGISSFNAQPQKVGKHHVKKLLELALSIVPKSQHSRTPIFLHATAGMRLLTPTEQQQINDNICSYIGSNSDFYIPECASHVNILNGDVEGLYGWLAINSLIGAFDSQENHDHGKNHYTYGLLDMGGASTQVVFQPNATEIKEHENNLYQINLAELPLLGGKKEPQLDHKLQNKRSKPEQVSQLDPRADADSNEGESTNSSEGDSTDADSNEGDSSGPVKGGSTNSNPDEGDSSGPVEGGSSNPTNGGSTDSNEGGSNPAIVGKYQLPQYSNFHVYSDSFLGYGMYQAHTRYLTTLVDEYNKKNNIEGNHRFHGRPIQDPCLPKGYTMSETINDISYDFTGESNFQKCLKMIFPVLLKSTHSTGTEDPNTNCKQFNEESEVSSCLLSDLIPAFDFDVNHFIGVSGYWDAIENLLSYNGDNHSRRHSRRQFVEFEMDNLKIQSDYDRNIYNRDSDSDEKDQKRDYDSDRNIYKREHDLDGKDQKTSKVDQSGDTYDYKLIYSETTKLCSQLWGSLIDLNSDKEKDKRMLEADLSVLCFKSSWILNFLHLGLGFPRFGIDQDPYKDNKFKSLQLVDEVGGSSFSWTLGRALLYANDEYVQAFNSYTIKERQGEGDRDDHQPRDAKNALLNRPGFFHSLSPNVYHYGAEQNNIPPRPQFVVPSKDDKYPHYDYESYEELKWYLEPHRWYGIGIFMLLMSFIVWLLVGKSRRTIMGDKIKKKFQRIFSKVPTHQNRYSRVPTEDLETASYELDHIDPLVNTRETADRFKIDSEEED